MFTTRDRVLLSIRQKVCNIRTSPSPLLPLCDADSCLKQLVTLTGKIYYIVGNLDKHKQKCHSSYSLSGAESNHFASAL